MRVHTRDEHRSDHAPCANAPARDGRSRWRAISDTAGAVIGVILGIAPHVMHHIGLLAGAAIVTGASGNAIFYVIGLALSAPMLLRLYRRFRTAWAPAIAIAVFTGLFSLSAFVIGPAISGTDDAPSPPAPSPSPTGGHGEHH